jgi:hypothetical protein
MACNTSHPVIPTEGRDLWEAEKGCVDEERRLAFFSATA